MDFVDDIKINRVNNVVLVSCSPSSTGSAAASSSGDEEIASAGPNDAQAWSGRRLEGTLVLTGHHLLISSNANDREEIWLLHSNIDTLEIRGPGTSNAGSGAAAPSTPQSELSDYEVDA